MQICYRLYYGMKEFLEDQYMAKDDEMEVNFDPEDNGFGSLGEDIAAFYLSAFKKLTEERPDQLGLNQYDAHTMASNLIAYLCRTSFNENTPPTT